MTAELVKRAREFRPDWNVLSDERGMASVLIAEMADRIEELERERWVLELYADLSASKARCEALERERDEEDMLARLVAATRIARREALEEAARVADRLVDCDSRMMHGAGMVIAATQIAAAIRALKGKT
jgi:RPA family protein